MKKNILKTCKVISILLLFMSTSIFATNNMSLDIKISKKKTTKELIKSKLFKDNENYELFIKKVQKGLKDTVYYHYGYKFKGILVDNESIVSFIKNKKTIIVTKEVKTPEINLNNIDKNKKVFTSFNKNIKKLKFHSDIKTVLIIKNNKTYLVDKALVEYLDKTGYHLGVVYLDKVTGKKILFKSHLYEAINRKTYTINNRCILLQDDWDALPGSILLVESSDLGTDHVANDAHTNSGITYWFYKNMFNRDSFDNRGIDLVSTVHAKIPTSDETYETCYGGNAFFMGAPYFQMVYGDGDSSMRYLSQALDIVAHELTHAVTDDTSDLIYEYESGALNEAMSDIFGATAEAWANSGGTSASNPANFVANSNTWKIGEEVMIHEDAMRFMNNPRLASTPSFEYPDHYSNRYTGEQDHGGVHINSGIINLAYYLLVTGGNHPRFTFQNNFIDVEGIGLNKAIKIFYEAQVGLLSQDTDFSNARRLFSLAAENLYGNCSNESEQVNRAFDIVGVLGSRRDECNNVTSCDGITCSNNGTCVLVNGKANCNCDAGYTASGLNCLANTGVCENINCAERFPNTHCYDDNGEAACVCDEGYHVNDARDACISDDVCLDVTCAENSTCYDNNGSPGCMCNDGYHVNDTQDGCVSDDVCLDVTCAENSTCYDNNGNPGCMCNDGYRVNDTQDGCVPEDVCLEINCPQNSTCYDNNGQATCRCDDGYRVNDTQDGCVPEDVCLEMNCPQNSTCYDNSGQATCKCDDGYHINSTRDACIPDEVDPCEGIVCSGHGTCVNNSGVASCNCDEGYEHDNNLHCVQKQVDLCESISCSQKGSCLVRNNQAGCECITGFHPEGLSWIEDVKELCENISCGNDGICAVNHNTNSADCICTEGYKAEGKSCVLDNQGNNNSSTSNSSGCDYNSNSNKSYLMFMMMGLLIFIIRKKAGKF